MNADGKYELVPVARAEGDVQIAVTKYGNIRTVMVDPTTGADLSSSNPVKVIVSGSATATITASGIAVAVPCTGIGFIVDDVGTSGTLQTNDNASAASGTQYGPTKLIAGQYLPYPIHFAAGAYVTLTGSAKVTFIYKADP